MLCLAGSGAGSIKARFENIAKQNEEEDRRRAEEERSRRQVKEKQEQEEEGDRRRAEEERSRRQVKEKQEQEEARREQKVCFCPARKQYDITRVGYRLNMINTRALKISKSLVALRSGRDFGSPKINLTSPNKKSFFFKYRKSECQSKTFSMHKYQ